MPAPATISVIIPTLNESANIVTTLRRVMADDVHEVIVADGGSIDDTVAKAQTLGPRIVTAPAGRGAQQNAGAAAASGEVLFFLHADTLPPVGFVKHIRGTLAQPGMSGGAFGFRLDGDRRAHRLVERFTRWRSRVMQLPYGDQGLFATAAVFRAVGGFPDSPIMEDVELVRRLRAHGRIALAPADMLISARRWNRKGVIHVTTTHQFYLLAWKLGVSPQRIARWRGHVRAPV